MGLVKTLDANAPMDTGIVVKSYKHQFVLSKLLYIHFVFPSVLNAQIDFISLKESLTVVL